jgi:hypothetical protein
MFKHLAAIALPLLLLAAPANADGWKDKDGWRNRHEPPRHGRNWDDHNHHWRGRTTIVVWGGPAYRPYYPPVYYRPVYYPPAVYAPPVYAPAPTVYDAPTVNAVPTRDFRDNDGRYCREYQRTATIDGREQQIYGTACLMPDGSWQIVSE